MFHRECTIRYSTLFLQQPVNFIWGCLFLKFIHFWNWDVLYMFFLFGGYFTRNLTKNFRSSPPEVFLGKGVLKICSKFTGEHPCRSAISIKLQSNFIGIRLQHGCSPINLLHLFRTPMEGCFWYLLLTSVKQCQYYVSLEGALWHNLTNIVWSFD